ncbi:MAG TPA: RNA-binding S4 domain-containing protein [Acidimicrobiales bacterium]|nr:RNA-binding S4 domain-containing protein [Acidimicrobiales bacterium]
MSGDTARVDKWLWSVRVFKTRSMATDACRAGHVAVNRGVTKPSTPVKVGDVVTIRAAGRDRVLEVARVIDNRVGAPIAAECVIDHSPPPPPRELAAPPLVRDPATGRPTKRDRRQIDRLQLRRR